MKAFFSATFVLCAISFVNGAATNTGTSAISTSTSIPAPKGFQPSNVTGFVRPDTDQPDLTTDTTAGQSWVCLSISPSTLRWGAAQGNTESSALGEAEKLCAERDCNRDWWCIEFGCIGLDYGLHHVYISMVRGDGKNDASKAKSLVLADCKAHDVDCGNPDAFCSQYVL